MADLGRHGDIVISPFVRTTFPDILRDEIITISRMAAIMTIT
jgi:hypothetical protein